MKLPILLLLLALCLSHTFAADPADAPPLRDRKLVGMEPITNYGQRGEKWSYENRLTIKGGEVTLEKSPVFISKGKKLYSSSDGGFYSYRGTVRLVDGRWQMELRLTGSDYVLIPVDREGKPNPPMQGIFDVTFLADGSLVLDKVTYQKPKESLFSSLTHNTVATGFTDTEIFANDPFAKEADLAYRVSIHSRKPSIAMQLYLHFQPTPTPGEVRMQGRFVVSGKSGPPYRDFTREKTLTHEEVMELLRCIREHEIFNLPSQPPYAAAEDVAAPTFGVIASTLWAFERYQAKSPKVVPSLPQYTVIWRAASDRGPAHEVYTAFYQHAAALLPDNLPR